MKFPIPTDWDGVSWCRWAVCWPQSEQWEGLLRGFLTLPQRGRTWDERTGTITEIQAVGREITEQNLPLVEVLMACNDTGLQESFSEIALALRYLADRQFAKPCCGDGSGGAVGGGAIVGVVVQPIGGNTIPIYGTLPPAAIPDGETFPEGFESIEDWDAHKCSVANTIFDGVLGTLSGLATLNLLNVNVLGVLVLAALAAFLPFPPAAIPVMIGALIALAASQALLLEARSYLVDNREEWVCWLYEAESVEDLIAILADGLDAMIALIGVSGPIGTALKLVLMLLFNGDALNQLFDSNADYQYPNANCEGCLPCEETWFNFDAGNEGFVSVGSLPSCFGLALNGSCVLSWDGGVLFAIVSGGSPGKNGAFGQTGLDILVSDQTNIQTTLRMSGAGSLYIDFVIVFSDASCLWGTLSNNDAASGAFHGLSASLSAHAGKHISELYFFCSSSNAGADGTYLVEFDAIGLFCELP